MKPLIAITGASSGIGKACAQIFSQNFFPLLLLARRIELLDKLKLPQTLTRKVDVSNLNSFSKALQDAQKIYGPVNCLINNAGIMLLELASQQNPHEWESMLNTNLKGLLNGVHLVLKPMIQQNNGTIINISSIAGKSIFPYHSVYCATKFAVHSISESLRQETSHHNIRFINIAPGCVNTPLSESITSEKIKHTYQKFLSNIPYGGALNPKSVAEIIFFAYQQPQKVCIREITVAPTGQTL